MHHLLTRLLLGTGVLILPLMAISCAEKRLGTVEAGAEDALDDRGDYDGP